MSSPPPLPITIRFSSSLPDLPFTIEDPHLTSVLTLIQRIRASLPSASDSRTSRIRLIYSGRILPLTSSLTSALRLPPPPPRSSHHGASKEKEDIKGKTPIRPGVQTSTPSAPTPQPPSHQPNVYIHAHFSESLPASALDAERLAALDADRSLEPSSTPSSPTSPISPTHPLLKSSSSSSKPHPHPNRSSHPTISTTATTPASPLLPLHHQPAPPQPAVPQQPLGFDRLLSGGLSASEVASLRAQFVAQLAHTRTPDAMPSAAELRAMEERWLDNDNDAGGFGQQQQPGGGGGDIDGEGVALNTTTNNTGTGGGGGIRGFLGLSTGQNAGGAGPAGAMTGGGAGVLGDEEGGMLEDMLWGNIMGFFWPVGAVLWLMREEGVWSNRKRLAVMTGAMVNLVFGVMRAAG